jgi:hypothetical protein
MCVVVSVALDDVFGPFDTEDEAIAWAKTKKWAAGYRIRTITAKDF